MSSQTSIRSALVCWHMCAQVEENHIIIALRNWDFSGLSCVFGIYWLQFILCGTIDIAAVLRYPSVVSANRYQVVKIVLGLRQSWGIGNDTDIHAVRETGFLKRR